MKPVFKALIVWVGSFWHVNVAWSAEGILDFLRFMNDIEPILVTTTYSSPGPGLLSCIDCHGNTAHAAYSAYPLVLGQTRDNYTQTAQRVSIGDPDTSLLLLKPLAVGAGGISHGLIANDGGKQFANTTSDINYITILDWIVDATQASEGAKVSKTMAYPTPFRTTTNIVYFLTTEAEEVNIRIFSYSGREVRHYEGTTNIGANQVEWDGRDEDFEPLATGVYFYSVKARFENSTFLKTGRCVYTP